MGTATILSIILTATVSAISLTVSIITVILNNRHQRKIKVLDIIYEKKYKHYQEFFNMYAQFYTENEIDKTNLSNTIMSCLLLANKKTSKYLELLLKSVNGTRKPLIHSNYVKIDFEYCIDSMKEELNLN